MRLPSSLLAVPALVLLTIPVATVGASAQDIFITPIPNAPFSAVVDVERSSVGRDGSIANSKTVREIARDGSGRIHNESRDLVPVSYTKTPRIVRIHIYDPQTRVSTYLDPNERTFWTETVSHPPSAVPPTVRFGAQTGDGLPQSEFAQEEDLGTHQMEGLSVHGVRETQMIPAENGGTQGEIAITDEYWYSEDLRINLMVRHSDPRTGTVTMTVSEVARTEPDPAFFEIPRNYKSARGGRATNH